jgi:hypothetical protein
VWNTVRGFDNGGTGHSPKNHRSLLILFQVERLHGGQWPTQWNTVVLEELTVPQLVKFPAFYGVRRFSVAFTTARQLSLSWAESVQATSSHFLNIRFNIILPFTLRPFKWSLSLRFPYQNRVCNSPLPHTCHMPRPSPSFDCLNNVSWGVTDHATPRHLWFI